MSEISDNTPDEARPVVLIVDDEPSIVSALKRLMRSQGYDTLEAANGAEALDIAGDAAVDLVLTDMRMPEMDGAEFLSAFNEIQPDVPKILLTGYADLESTISAINTGRIFAYLGKPWDDEELIRAAANALEQRQLRRERDSLLAQSEAQKAELASLNQQLQKRIAQSEAELEQTVQMMDSLAHQEAAPAAPADSGAARSVLSSLAALPFADRPGYLNELTAKAVKLAEKLGISGAPLEDLRTAIALLGLGRLGLSGRARQLPMERLPRRDREDFQRYPAESARLAGQLPGMEAVARVIAHHREYTNGKGFPQRVAGDAIPLPSRIILVVMEYLDLRQGRLVPRHYTDSEARRFLLDQRGKRYDTQVVNRFLETLPEAHYEEAETDKDGPALDRVKPGMVLRADLKLPDGTLIAPRGYHLDEALLDALGQLQDHLKQPLPIDAMPDPKH